MFRNPHTHTPSLVVLALQGWGGCDKSSDMGEKGRESQTRESDEMMRRSWKKK
jgi:hypothetical protein